jgi:predicted permease
MRRTRWSVPWIESLWRDVRHACRMFAKNPGFSAIAVISIAFGTGANVAMFSLADRLLLRPLPVLRPSEVLTVGSRVTRGISTATVASYPDYLDIRDRARSFSGLVALAAANVAFTPRNDGHPQVKLVSMVSSNFFHVLGVDPEIGRGFLPQDDRVPGNGAVAVLTYATWMQEFAGDRSVLGRRLQIGGLEFTIVGVAPERFTGLHPYVQEAAYVPITMWSRVVNLVHVNPFDQRDFRYLTVRGRLNRGISLAEARAELATIGNDLERTYPATNARQALTANAELEERFERRPLDSALIVVMTTLSVAVLCVACANVAGLLASRAPVRAREMAVRLAVGAGRARLIRQLVTESLGIALAGALGGLGVGYVGVALLRQIDFPTEVFSLPQLQIDKRALVFSLGLAMASAFLFGLGPAIHTTRVNLVNALKATDSDVAKRHRLTMRGLLVGLQVALSLVLLTMSVYAFQVFRRMFSQGPGFRTSLIAKVTIDPSQARYGETQAAQFFERAVERARRLPGVGSVAVTSAMPLFSFEATMIAPEAYQLPEGQSGVSAFSNSVDEGYFDTMAIPILQGRPFRSTDDAAAHRVAIVNDTFARHYWPGREALGKRFKIATDLDDWVEIVGIAKTSMYGYFGEAPQDMIYFPFRQRPRSNMVLLAQTSGDSSTLLTPLRELLHTLDADVPAYDFQTMERFYAARATTIARVMIRLIGGMGFMGMTLTTVGLYGLVSYTVSRRTREIGIRVAIGATYNRVIRMILLHGMTPALGGVACGLVLSFVTTRLLPAIVPFGQRYDSRMFLVVVPALLVVTLVAAFVPARRAARVDPTTALRYE